MRRVLIVWLYRSKATIRLTDPTDSPLSSTGGLAAVILNVMMLKIIAVVVV